MYTCLEVLEGVRDGGGRLGGLLFVGGAELLVNFLGVEDAVDRRRPQALRAVQVQRGRAPGLHHELADLDLAGAPPGDVLGSSAYVARTDDGKLWKPL